MFLANAWTMLAHAVGLAVSLCAGQLATAHDPCLSSEECIEKGQCTSIDGDCVATRAEDCRRSERCREIGFCTVVDGECFAASHEECRASLACTRGNRCYFEPEERICDDGTEDADRPLLIGGAVFVAVGGAAVLGGAFCLLMVAATSPMGPEDGTENTTGLILGVSLVGGGLVTAFAAGLPMLIVGGRDVPRDSVSATPTVILAPTGAGLRWSF